MEGNLQELKEHDLKLGPEKRFRNVCKLWNEASNTFKNWANTTVSVPSYRKTISFPWEAFQSSFVEDIEKYKSHMSGVDLLSSTSPEKPLETSTINCNVEAYRRMASAIIRSGKPASTITSLSDLVTQQNLRAGLDAYKDHLGDIQCARIHNMIGSLKSLADKYLK